MADHFLKVIELLKLEAAAIERAADRLDKDSLERSIDIIGCCSTKVVVIGVGKSGVIAQKIAQTLTSTGTVAIFVHPSDALHGTGVCGQSVREINGDYGERGSAAL